MQTAKSPSKMCFVGPCGQLKTFQTYSCRRRRRRRRRRCRSQQTFAQEIGVHLNRLWNHLTNPKHRLRKQCD